MDSSGSFNKLPADRRPTPPHAVPQDVLKPAQTHAPVSAEPCGTTIDGHYKILSLLGTGGMSAVFKAHDLHMDRMVAIKMLHPHLVGERKNLDRFLQEARAESSLKHPNVLSVLSVGITQDGRLFLVMDFLQGESLADQIEINGPMDQAQAREIFIQICDGLEHAHANGIVHRDLKPSNVMLCPDQAGITAKIVDFGIAKLVGTDKQQMQKLTQTGAVLGSPAYMSPEQCSGKLPDPRSDIYSMGCLMYEVLTGRVPFESTNHLEAMCKQIGETPPAFSEVAPAIKISADIESIVYRALEKSPQSRQQTAAQLKDELERADLTSPQTHSTRTPVRQSVSGLQQVLPQNRQAMVLSVTMAAVGVLAASAFVFWKPIDHWAESTLVVPALKQRVQAAQAKSESVEYLQSLVALGDELWKLGITDGALKVYGDVEQLFGTPAIDALDNQKVLEIVQRLHGADKQSQAETLQGLAKSYRKRLKYLYAEDTLKAALQLDDLVTVQRRMFILIDLTDVEIDRGNAEAAQTWAQRAMELARREHQNLLQWNFGVLLNRLAQAEAKQGLYAAAESSFSKALQIFPTDVVEFSTTRAAILKDLAKLRWYQRQDAAGDEAMNNAIVIYQSMGAAGSRQLATALGDMADHLITINQLGRAEPWLERAVALTPASVDPFPMKLRQRLGDCYMHDGRYRDAELLYATILRWVDAHPQAGMDRSLTARAIDDCHRKLAALR